MLVNSFCVTENGAIECQNMPGQVLYMDDLIEGVQSRGTDLLNNLKPFGWVSKELSLKRFLLMCVSIQYSVVVVSCAIAILLYGLKAGIADFINHVSPDWSRFKYKKKKQTQVRW